MKPVRVALRARSALLAFAVASASNAVVHARGGEERVPAAVQRFDVTLEGARAQLESGEPLAVAWGAHHAGTRGWRELAPELRAALRSLGEAKRTSNEAQDQARDTLIDALLRLDLPLAPDELARWGSVERLLPLLLAHAAFDPAACAPWLRSIVASERGTLACSLEWSSAAALLARGAPELATPLLVRRARPEIRIVVRTRWQLPLDEDRKPALGSCGNDRIQFGTRKALPSFPPLVSTMLVRGTAATQRTVLETPLALSLVRTETAELSLATRATAEPDAIAEDAFRILAWLVRADAPAELDLVSARPELALGFSTPERFVEEATERVAHVEARWRALVAALEQHGWLDADAARTEARPLTVRVDDQRREPRAPLPALPAR